jgi:chemotaxis protein methyltransferase CheR
VTLEVQEFEFIRSFLQARSAIVLDDEKQYLVESRLQPLARREGLASVGELVSKMRLNTANGLQRKVIEALTTHETSFFRDQRPFEALRKVVLPDRIAAQTRSRMLRIWCMACSTGQEPYSIAMLLREDFPQLRSWNVGIVATDLSVQILEKAREAVFSQLEVSRGLPSPYLLKYFHRQGTNWQLNDDIRKMVEFRQMNLIEPWPASLPVDIVFLRNVLIYFDIDAKKDILARVRRLLNPEGYLFLGGAETTFGLDESFKRFELEKTSVYRLIGAVTPSLAC